MMQVDQQAVIDWVLSCRQAVPTGGGAEDSLGSSGEGGTSGGGGCAFGGSPRNDPHLLYTLSAVQILALYDKLDLLDADAIAKCGYHFTVHEIALAIPQPPTIIPL